MKTQAGNSQFLRNASLPLSHGSHSLPTLAETSEGHLSLPRSGHAGVKGWARPHSSIPALPAAQRNEWCSTLQQKVTDQHLVGTRPRPPNTAHCQKSGTLELKGQKSKVFAVLSLPEMWLYKSEQVGGNYRNPHTLCAEVS